MQLQACPGELSLHIENYIETEQYKRLQSRFSATVILIRSDIKSTVIVSPPEMQ